MIPAVVFSRNRACQLDALLSSLATNAPGMFDVTVLFRADTDEYQHAYNICASEHSTVGFMGETAFADQLTRLIPMEGPVGFFVDDDVLFRPIPGIPDLAENWACFSLRLGPANTDFCYPHQRKQRCPSCGDNPDLEGLMVSWPWREYEGDFSYPASLDGHAFNSDLIRAFLQMSHPDPLFDKMSNPNEWEDFLAARFVAFQKPAMMASFARSALVGIPQNIVNDSHRTNRVMADGMSAEDLNRKFLDGWRVAWDEMDYSGVNAAHCEIPLKFRKAA